MKHQAPRVMGDGSQQEGPGVDQLVGHVIRKMVPKVNNPVVEAIFDEMSPEIDGLLKKHLGGQHVDVTKMANAMDRAGRVIQRVQERRRKSA
jgi:hypothetical protein